MKTCISRVHPAVLSLAMGISFSALAQPSLPEVFVTASRGEQEIALAPIGATVITGQDILDSGVVDANEAVRLLGGVSGRRDLNGGREAVLDLRGFGDAATNNLVVLVDGVRISENEISGARLSGISPDMVERIEILRGSSSVLWGEGASAGVINVITKTGQSVHGTHGQMSLSAESFGGRDVRGDLQSESELFSLSAQVRSYRTDGYRQNSQHRDDAVNLGVAFGGKKTLKGTVSYFSEDLAMRWPGALPLATFLTSPQQTNTPNDSGNQKQERWVITLERQWENALLTVDFARRHRSADSFQDYGYSFTESNRSDSVSYQLSPRVLWNGNWDGAAVSTIFGADFAQWDYARLSDFSGSISEEKGHQTSHALYLRTDVALTSQLRINAGVRNEKFSHQIDNLSSGTRLRSEPSLSAAELGLSYAFMQSWNAYARLASSYRVANVDELRYLSAALEPQTARDLELGLRYQAGNMNYGLRVFAQRTRNEIAYDNSVIANINLDPVRRIGVELEGGMQLMKQLKVSTVAQVISAELVEGAYSGNALPLAPKSTVLLRATYDVAPGHAVDASFRSVGSAPFGNDWTNRCSSSVPHANFLDLGYRYKAQARTGWSAFIGVDNLLDEQTYSVGYTNSSCSAYNVYPDAGRRVKASASYRF